MSWYELLLGPGKRRTIRVKRQQFYSRDFCEALHRFVAMHFSLFAYFFLLVSTSLAAPSALTRRACGPTALAGNLSPNGVPGHVIAGQTGQCLAVQNATTTQGPTIVGVDCASAADEAVMSWAFSDGFLFVTGGVTSACSSGLYGYQAESSSGAPSAIQKAPITLGCSTASNVFGFSVLV
ncbi:hypothetical protein JB92DRAFT_2829202 [Gautieria morchelliformis]|nr:hypothetical protein JB92DRAFT_2829202 [Gautieria morchelliformis]